MTGKIFIASNSHDRPATQPVADIVTDRGYDPIVYESDLVAYGKKHFGMHIGSKGLQAVYDGKVVYPIEYSAAWLRRPATYPIFEDDIAFQTWLNKERTDQQRFIWEAIPDDRWLNPPGRIIEAQKKIPQLAIAHSLGFTIPCTTVSNSLETINGLLPPGDIISKVSRPLLPTAEGYKSHYTNIYTANKRNHIQGFPFPAIWQPFIPKAREWRITSIDGEFFDAAVYTTEEAKDDWRRHYSTGGVTFAKDEFPEREKRKCQALLDHYRLKYGAFDFIETPDGEIIFLELNPNGQYGWLEKNLGFPISQRIAQALIRIAERSS